MDAEYWNKVYKTKNEKEVSWFQETPTTSLKLIDNLNLPPESSVIDIGGGESRLVDNLLDKNFINITVLDISEVSLEKVKLRLKDKLKEVKLISSDVINYAPSTQFDLWHDRAAFHFLTDLSDIKKYVQLVADSVKVGGFFIVSTFSKTGPDKCSGLTISKYSHEELIELFSKHFKNLSFSYEIHETPWSSKQDFVYCVFKRT